MTRRRKGEGKGRKNKYAYKLIQLTRGLVAAVSPEDYERVNKYHWHPKETAGKIHGIRTTIKSRNVALHRFILGLRLGNRRHVDHWNQNVFDNLRCNLRICTNADNIRNAKKHGGAVRKLTSRYKGVSRNHATGERGSRRFFSAYISARGKTVYLGRFKTEVEAAKAYDAAARKEYGKYARLNFPRRDEVPPTPPPEVVNQRIQPTDQYTPQRHPSRTSKYVGISTAKNKWRWRVGKHAKGGFSTELAAAKARDAFIIEKGWPHRLNFPKKKRRKR